MARLTYSLQINMAVLASLSTLLLGMGQRDPWLPVLMLVVAFGSVWLTDITGRFRLNRAMANLAVLLALVLSVGEVLQSGGGTRIAGLGNLLVYVQVVLLLQQKDDRVYWQLVMIGLLQVIVATAFSQGVGFGLVLVAYMLVGFSALALLLLHRQWNQYIEQNQLTAAKYKLDAPASGSGSRRWPLASQQAWFQGTPAGRGASGIERELFFRLGLMGIGTLFLTGLFFFTLPRLGRSAWRGAVARPQKMVGFSDRVTLGELGEIIESPREVMRVSLSYLKNGDPYIVREPIYLRGAILATYRDGAWEPWQQPSGTDRSPSYRRRPIDASLVLQEITIEPLKRSELFCIWPFVGVEENPDLRFDPRRKRLHRRGEQTNARFTYRLATTGLANGLQTPLTPCADPEQLAGLHRVPPLPRLSARASRWIDQSELPESDPIGRARWLAKQFHDSGQFQYSLTGQARNPNIDPIEDFVSEHRRGHCEYFATALALMLRSQGIPSRVVLGFKCDEFNALGGFYQVRQRHAHAWVEAHIRPQSLPPELRDNRRWSNGGWLRLEPTPGAAADPPPGATSWLGRLGGRLASVQSIWGDYVVEMDRRRQRSAVYRPVADAVRVVSRRVRDPAWWRDLPGRLAALLHLPVPGAAVGWALFVAIAAIILAVVLLLRRRIGNLWRWVRWRWAAATVRGRLGGPSSVDFYRRLERLLARHELVRLRGQTQQEFARIAGRRLAERLGRPELAALPPRVAEAFYAVRFGRRPLDTPQAQAVEQALAELKAVEQ